jgi:hypothetical protein
MAFSPLHPVPLSPIHPFTLSPDQILALLGNTYYKLFVTHS